MRFSIKKVVKRQTNRPTQNKTRSQETTEESNKTIVLTPTEEDGDFLNHSKDIAVLILVTSMAFVMICMALVMIRHPETISEILPQSIDFIKSLFSS